ncbi:hypothetical protein NP233_g3148 [Leucocoprinus birnbaumii]|uniref:Phosphatidyl-N-methylethanolamine N-methyltransferase n=1 Tax=Leucocoprinus birnbaumii TaxID=56174 RepID=A0AAD5YU78_9AGAR|nr:hypothetical protein NP233_g3148 [Leucocoprinus birnbaumii]
MDKINQFNSLLLENTVFDKKSLLISLASITFNPTAWNIVARNEYHNKTITRLFNNNPRHGCYFLALLIFSFGIFRDSLYHQALADQPTVSLLPEPFATYVPVALFVLGQIFVVTSTWALGITGTFLGDYFGILMDHRVTGFPFNVLENPMYVGSTMCFLGTALWYEKPAGVLITIYVWTVYAIALRFEGLTSLSDPILNPIFSKCLRGSLSNKDESQNFILNNVQIADNSINHSGSSGIDILREASDPKAAHDSGARQYAASCFPGTREQYIDDIARWVVSSSVGEPHVPVYWVRGPAGAGKSAIAQSCAERLKDIGSLGASFFFSVNSCDYYTRFFPTIACQLAIQLPEYREILNRKLSIDRTVVQKTMKVQFKELLLGPLRELERMEKRTGKRAIIIDGLDECKDKGAQCEIIDLIVTFARESSAPLCWAIFSRSEPHLQATIMKSDYSRFFHVTVLPISREADEDIELYLQNGLKNVLRRRNILLSYPWPSKRDIEALVNAAAGLFIYPATIIRFVDQTGRAPEELLKLVLGALGASSGHRSIGSNGATIQPFAELDAFYMLIMRRIPENLLPSVQLLLTLAIMTPFESCTWSAIGLSNMLGFSESQFRLVCNELHAVLHFQEADALGAHPDLPCTKLIHSTTLSDIPQSGNAWLRQAVSRLGGVLTFYHKSFYDFLSDPIRSGTFCVSTSRALEELFKYRLRIHLDYAESFHVHGQDLVHAYDGPSNVLSWPARVALIDSYIKVVTFNNAGFTLLHALHPYNQLDPQIVGLLADFDFRKHLLSQPYVFSGALVSRSINLGFPSLAKYVRGTSISTMLCRIPPSFFHAFDGRLFRESVRQLEKHGVIRKMHSSDLMTRLRKNSGKSRGKVTSGLYKKGYGNRKTYWYWEFSLELRYYQEFETGCLSEGIHRHPAPSCFPGTRQQYIEDITQGVDHRTDDTRQLPPIYCMTGPAGVGKSAIAQTCTEHLQRLNMLGAAFFFSVNGRDDHTRFFPSLAYQLSTNLPESYRDLLNHMILKDKTLVYKRLDSQFQMLIVEPLPGLNPLNHTVSRKAILIDGLDECKSKDAQCEIIRIIAASVKNGDTPFCWAFFSRPEAHIKAIFENPDINKFTSFVFLPISCGIDAEIELYLKGAFENLVRRHNLHVSHPWPSTAQFKTLLEAASGLFVYAATLLRFIEQFTLDPNEPLNEVLELIYKSSRNVRAGPPARATAFYELDMFYKHVIGRIPKDALPSTLRFLAVCLLSPFGSAWEAVLLSNLLRLSKVKFWSICHILQPVLYCRMESHDDSQTSSGALQAKTEDNGVLFMYHKSFYDF